MYYSLRDRESYERAFFLSRKSYKSKELWEHVSDSLVYDVQDDKFHSLSVNFITILRTIKSNKILVQEDRDGYTCSYLSHCALPFGVEPTLDNCAMVNSHYMYINTLVLNKRVHHMYLKSVYQPLGVVFDRLACYVVSNVLIDDSVFELEYPELSVSPGSKLIDLKEFKPSLDRVEFLFSDSLVEVVGG